MSKESEVKNLEKISKAITNHNVNCEFDILRIEMNNFELERLGWNEIRGIPIVASDSIGTGRFRIICANDKSLNEELEIINEVKTTYGKTHITA